MYVQLHSIQLYLNAWYTHVHTHIILVFSGANKEALAVAQASGAEFIRAESYVFSHVADEGWMDSCAGKLQRYRKMIDANEVLVLTDIKKKHWYVLRKYYCDFAF